MQQYIKRVEQSAFQVPDVPGRVVSLKLVLDVFEEIQTKEFDLVQNLPNQLQEHLAKLSKELGNLNKEL